MGNWDLVKLSPNFVRFLYVSGISLFTIQSRGHQEVMSIKVGLDSHNNVDDNISTCYFKNLYHSNAQL